MKFLILALFISLPALSVPESLLNMRPDRAYMSFIANKYIAWHFKTFQFPALTPVEKELVANLNHWVLPESEAYSQLSLCQRENKGDGHLQTLRLWIAPELRERKEFAHPFKKDFSPHFYERNTLGFTCLIGEVFPKESEAWCRKGHGNWALHHTEKVVKDHIPFRNPFPIFSEEETRITDPTGELTAIYYHRAMSHVSAIPQTLLMVVRAHSLDTAFGLDRYTLEKDGTMSVCYP